VRPRPEWRDDPNCVPTGRVREVVPWGKDESTAVIYVEVERRGFCAFVFEHDDADPPDPQLPLLV